MPETCEGEGIEDEDEAEEGFVISESEPERTEEDDELEGDVKVFLSSGDGCWAWGTFALLSLALGRSGALYARRFVVDNNCTGKEISFRLIVPAANFCWFSR